MASRKDKDEPRVAEKGSIAEGVESAPARRPARATGMQARRPRTTRTARPREPEENSIRPSRVRSRDRAQSKAPSSAPPDEGRDDAQLLPLVPATPTEAARTESGKAESDPWTVPQSVRDRFQQDGHRFYFPDGKLAFRDRGRKLTTESENTQVINSLVQIALARGWQEITVAGTERFRQEAWRQARIAGLAVRGYRPKEAERAQLIRAIGNRAQRARDVSEPGGPSQTAAADPQTSATGDPTRASGASGQGREKGLLVGKLLDHGRDTYRFDPHEEMSYFLRLQTPEGKKEIWGKDLQRAMHQSLTQPQIGDEIGLRRNGQDVVTVKRRERDEQGQVVSEKDLATHRNRWVIEKREFFEERSRAANVLRDLSIEPKRAVRNHPELAGTYLNLRAAEIAARAIRDPEDQRRFVALVRGALADAVERGEPLQPARLKAPERRRSRSPEKIRDERETLTPQ